MFKAHFDIRNLNKIINALEKLEALAELESAKTPENFAKNFAADMRDAISSQTYASRYSRNPLTPNYAKSKAKNYGHTDFWKLRGDLISNVTFWSKSNNEWEAGLNEGVPGFRGKHIGAYAFFNEFGWNQRTKSGKRFVRPRPLLRYVADDFCAKKVPIRATMLAGRIARIWRSK